MAEKTITEEVDALRERGYVELMPDPSDGRAKLVCLTGRGQAFLDAAVAAGESL